MKVYGRKGQAARNMFGTVQTVLGQSVQQLSRTKTESIYCIAHVTFRVYDSPLFNCYISKLIS